MVALSEDVKRGEWGVAVPITESLYRIRLRNPIAQLMVNTYLYVEGDAVAVFDPGWPWTLDALESVLELLGFDRGFEDVTHWVYTHTHIDHMGPAALLSQRSQAPHINLKTIEPELAQWHAFQDRMNNWQGWAADAIADQNIVARFKSRHKKRSAAGDGMVSVHGAGVVQNAALFAHGDTVEIGALKLEILDVRGHDPYHIAFYEPDRRWLFSGDVLLSTPTPISRAMQDSLPHYIESLDRLATYDVDLLLPGHGVHRTEGYVDAVANSRSHVEKFQADVRRALTVFDEPAGLVPVAMAVFPQLFEQNQTQMVVNLALIDSHLQAMVATGEVTVSPGPRYKAS